MAAETPPRVLKKYGNRRLYDTGDSRYVTLAEVEALIQAGHDVEVVDAKSGEDLTREVLAQIICDREQSREVLPVAFLKQVIHSGASPALRERFTDHLVGSLRGFADAQRAFAAEMQKASAAALRHNPFLNPFGAAPPRAQSVEAPPPAAIYGAQAETRAELDEMKAELKATQALLKELVHGQRPVVAAPEPARPRRKRASNKKKARG